MLYRVRMSFLDIKDPVKRDEIVKDYLETIRRVQESNENEKVVGLARKTELENTFNPIVEATKKSTKEITEKLNPLHTELKKINNQTKPMVNKQIWNERMNIGPFDYYSNKFNSTKLDKYFGMKRIDDKFYLGDSEVQIDADSNIYIDDTTYNVTPGLWSLIMLNAPEPDMYDENDLEAYTKLVVQTNLLNEPKDVTASSRPLATKKGQMLQLLMKGEKSGSGTIFLPGDIKGLVTKLELLLSEFHAGNTTTRNEIVAILDELKRRKKISPERYQSINSYLGATL